LFARKHGGKFILRIDDTDQERNVEEALAPILRGLKWLGLDWDEGPEVGGPCAPYYQSQRLPRYQQAVRELLARGLAYRDYARPEEIQAEREAAEREKQTFVYSRRYAARTPDDEARFEAEGRTAVVRLKMPREGKLVLDDLIRGRVEFDWAREQDHVIQRADGSCLYHLASVVDDHDFGITHVIRAEEHLSNTPRQVFIAQGLGYSLPQYAHLPFVAEPGSRTKLSKRKLDKYLKNRDFAQLVEHGRRIAEAIGLDVRPETFNPVITDFYEQVGYLPEAIVNYLALLGWSLDDKTEHFTIAELIEHFSLDRVNKAPASFDPRKLMAFQAWHMQRVPLDRKTELVLPFLEKAQLVSSPPSDEQRRIVRSVVTAAGDRIRIAGDILEYDYFFRADDEYKFDPGLLRKHIATREDANRLRECREQIRLAGAGVNQLRQAFARLSNVATDTTTATPPPGYDPSAEWARAEEIESLWISKGSVEQSFHGYVDAEDIRMADIIHKVRVAITGREKGLGLFDSVEILGRKKSIRRIDRALAEAGFPELASRPTTYLPAVSQLPIAIQEVVDFSHTTTPIVLHDGHLNILYPSEQVTGRGRLELRLAPSPAITFSMDSTPVHSWPLVGEAELRIPDLGLSVPAIVTRAQPTSEMGTIRLEGVPNGPMVVGRDESLDSVVFHVTDFHDFVGHAVRNATANCAWSGRLCLAAENWLITVDAVPDHLERRQVATKSGGIPITHVGRIERKDATPFTGKQCEELLSTIHFFLSFVRGQWVAPLIPVGFDKRGDPIWRDLTLRRTSRAPSFNSWCPIHHIGHVEALFPKFFRRWMDPVWREFLRPAIGSYLHANRQGLLDDTVIFAQIVLEMIADFVFMEQSGSSDEAASGIEVVDRIGRLFQRIGIPTALPDKLVVLRQFADAEGLSSGLAVIASIRNACVHHNAHGRRLLARLNATKHAFYDASRLALWYTDLCLLWLLGYEGRYQSRVHAEWVGETEAVPWTKAGEYLPAGAEIAAGRQREPGQTT
jgi:glutamyl-tRNA synthetase